MLKNYGDFISEDEFNSFIPKQIKEYESTYPYTESYDGDLSTLIEEQPIQLANGNIYYGHWNNQNYKMEGPGELFLRKDSVYVKGFWKDGKLYRGRLHLPDCIYEGDIDDCLFDGQGKIIYQDGSSYEGDFVQGRKEGNGKYIWKDGSNYWGEFKDDDINGKGQFNWINGYSYDGEHEKGKFNGYGILRAPNGSSYTGTFYKGMYHGKGTFTWGKENKKENNEKYTGEYKYSKKEGNGRYFFKNGDVFEGIFFDGNPHGEGRYESDDIVYKSFWRNGQMVEKPLIESQKSEDEIKNIIIKKEDIDFKQIPNNNNDDNFNPSLISKNSNYKSKINLKDEAVMEYFNS